MAMKCCRDFNACGYSEAVMVEGRNFQPARKDLDEDLDEHLQGGNAV